MLIGGYASLYLMQHGFSIADISFLKAFQSLVIVLIQIPIGYLIDNRSNRYPFILISIFFAAIWMFLTAVGNNSIYFFIAELFNALSLAIFNAVMLPILVETYTYETGKNDYNYTLGKFFKYQNLLMAISVILGSGFVRIDSRYVWLVSAFLLFSTAIFSILSKDIKKFNFLPPSNSERKVKKHFRQIIELIKTENLMILLLVNIALTTVFQILAQFWQVIIYSYLDENTSYALTYGLIFSAILLLQAVGSHLAEKRSSLKLSLLSMLLFVGNTAYLIFFNNYFIFKVIPVILFIMSFILFKYPSIIISAILHKNINNKVRATFDSIISLLTMVISTIVFYLIGVLLNKYGNNVIMLSLGSLSLLSLLLTSVYLLKNKYTLKNSLAAA
ncbi:MFS transporter [Legionella pneumophila]|nr:MFS transporter [Legionella pneumophila]